MASEEDPDVVAGRAFRLGQTPSQSGNTNEDPQVAAGRAFRLGQPTPDTPAIPTSGQGAAPPTNALDTSMTPRGTVRQIAGGAVRGGGDIGNILSDPYANLIGRPILTAGQTVYDFLAPFLGYERLTPEQRNALYADFSDQPGERAIRTIGANVPGGPPIDPYNLPGTPREKLAGTIAEGATVGTAFAPGVAGIPGGALAGGGGALGGQIASENVADWLKPGAEMVGTAAGAKLGGVTANVGTRVTNAVAGAKTPLAAAYDELGIDRRLVGDLSDNATARTLQAYGSKSPFGSSVVAPVEQKVVGQFGSAVEDTAKRLGTSTSEQTAGQVLQKEARNWKDVIFPQRQADAWAPVDRLLGGETVAPTNYRGALTALIGKLSSLPETAKILVPAKTWDLLDAINKDVPAGNTMSWSDAQSLRSAIGQVMGVPEIVQSMGRDQLKKAYAGISQDMKDTAAAVDARNAAASIPTPSAVNAFDNANRVSTEGHAFIEGPLSKIIQTTNPVQDIAPEKAASSVLGSGDTSLEALRREIPKAVDELGAFKLRDMALATASAAGRTGAETSVGSFLTDLNRLRQQDPGGFRALYSDPTVARRIDALATVADSMKETARRANVSGTGPYMALGEAAGSALTAWLATQDPYYAAGAIALPYAANRGVARVMTNPLLARVASAPGPRATTNPLMLGAMLAEEERRRREAGEQ